MLDDPSSFLFIERLISLLGFGIVSAIKVATQRCHKVNRFLACF
jgi:hypothetical protein